MSFKLRFSARRIGSEVFDDSFLAFSILLFGDEVQYLHQPHVRSCSAVSRRVPIPGVQPIRNRTWIVTSVERCSGDAVLQPSEGSREGDHRPCNGNRRPAFQKASHKCRSLACSPSILPSLVASCTGLQEKSLNRWGCYHCSEILLNPVSSFRRRFCTV